MKELTRTCAGDHHVMDQGHGAESETSLTLRALIWPMSTFSGRRDIGGGGYSGKEDGEGCASLSPLANSATES